MRMGGPRHLQCDHATIAVRRANVRAHAPRMIRSVARVALLVLLAGAIRPTSAAAHATLVQTTPADQQVLETQPREVTLKWSEAVDLGEHAVRLLDSAGEE